MENIANVGIHNSKMQPNPSQFYLYQIVVKSINVNTFDSHLFSVLSLDVELCMFVQWHALRAIIERRFLCACQAVSVMWGALSVMWGVGETHCWMCTSDYYLCVAQIMSDASPGHGGCATNKGSTVQEMEIQATSLAAVQQVQLMTITFFFPNLWHYPFIFKFNSRKLSIVCITKSMDSKAPLTNYWAKEQSADCSKNNKRKMFTQISSGNSEASSSLMFDPPIVILVKLWLARAQSMIIVAQFQ